MLLTIESDKYSIIKNKQSEGIKANLKNSSYVAYSVCGYSK